MGSSWIRDKVVTAVKADVEENGGDANEVIWQLSKDLKRMVRFGEPAPALQVAGSPGPVDPPSTTMSAGPIILPPTQEMLLGLVPVASSQGGDFDVIKRPSHYTEGRTYEPKDVIRDWGLNFNLGSATKYISRAGKKDDIEQELQKAITFLQFELDAVRKERSDESSKS